MSDMNSSFTPPQPQDFGPAQPTVVADMPPIGAPKKKSKTLVIILVIALVLLCCCCIGVIAAVVSNQEQLEDILNEFSRALPLLSLI